MVAFQKSVEKPNFVNKENFNYNFLSNKHLLLILLALFAAVLISQLWSVSQPTTGDGQAYVLPDGIWIRDHSFFPLPPDEVHPPLFFFLEALLFLLPFKPVIISHLLTYLFTALVLFYTFLLGRFLFNEKVAWLAVIFLFFCPLFFIQSSLLRLCLPLTAGSIAALYYALRRQWFAYFIAATAAALIKAPGVFVIPVAALYVLSQFKYKQQRKSFLIRELFWVALPGFPFLAWVPACKLHYGWFLHPENTAVFSWHLELLKSRFSYRLEQIFFSGNNIFLLIFCGLFFLKNLNQIFSKENSQRILKYLVSIFIAFSIFFICSDHDLVFRLTVSIFCTWLSFWLLNYGRYYDWALTGFILITIFFYISYFFDFPRYLLPIYPIIMVYSAAAIYELVGNRKLLKISLTYYIALVVCFLFIYKWFDAKDASNRMYYEANFSYHDGIKLRLEVIDYFKSHPPEGLILTGKPYTDLTDPDHGYIDKPLPAVPLFPEALPPAFDQLAKNISIFYRFPAERPIPKILLEGLSKNNLKLEPFVSFKRGNFRAELYKIVSIDELVED